MIQLVVRNRYQDYILSSLNSFQKFTFEGEKENKLSFLEIAIMRCGENAEICIYRQATNTDIYIKWNSFAVPLTLQKQHTRVLKTSLKTPMGKVVSSDSFRLNFTLLHICCS